MSFTSCGCLEGVLTDFKAKVTDKMAKQPQYPLSLLPQPEKPNYKLAVVGFTAPGGPTMNTDKDKTGVRYDSTPIANGVIKAGASCDLIDYTPDDHDGFAKKIAKYDGLIVRINPGQLSAPGVVAGAQMQFDSLMMSIVKNGCPVWSSPAVQTQLGAKDALVKIKDMSCGLPDTLDYCKNYGDAMLNDSDKLKLMEMNDNHVEYHTVG